MAVVLLIIWHIIGMFIDKPKILNLIGIVFGLILLLYGLKLFHIAIPA